MTARRLHTGLIRTAGLALAVLLMASCSEGSIDLPAGTPTDSKRRSAGPDCPRQALTSFRGLEASEVELRLTGRIRGDIVAPRVAMVEGSFFRGRLTTSGAARAKR